MPTLPMHRRRRLLSPAGGRRRDRCSATGAPSGYATWSRRLGGAGSTARPPARSVGSILLDVELSTGSERPRVRELQATPPTEAKEAERTREIAANDDGLFDVSDLVR